MARVSLTDTQRSGTAYRAFCHRTLSLDALLIKIKCQNPPRSRVGKKPGFFKNTQPTRVLCKKPGFYLKKPGFYWGKCGFFGENVGFTHIYLFHIFIYIFLFILYLFLLNLVIFLCPQFHL